MSWSSPSFISRSLSDPHAFAFFFFFNDTATTEIYTLSLHDALPISPCARRASTDRRTPYRDPSRTARMRRARDTAPSRDARSEEHTSELQSPCNLVCRLLLEKKKKASRGRYSERRSS